MNRFSLFLLLVVLPFSSVVHAQTSTVNGFVTEHSTGQAMEGATVARYEVNGNTPLYGTATNSEGFYLISKIDPGLESIKKCGALCSRIEQ